MYRKHYIRLVLVLLIFLSVSTGLSAQPASSGRCDPWVAQMASVQGTVEVRLEGKTGWQAAKLDDTYCAGDTIRVLDKSRADIALRTRPVLRLDQNSNITFGGIKEEKKSLVNLIEGAVHFFSRSPRSLDVQTAFVDAGVEGTEFFIRVDAQQTFISVFEGKVVASNDAGSLPLTDGQSAVTEQGKAPAMAVVARPRDAVQWSLYYPPVIHFDSDAFQAGSGWQGMVGNSLQSYRSGDIQGAFNAISGVPASVADARFLAYRSSLLLAVGRIDEANADIGRALQSNPNECDALALKSVIAVVLNEKDHALELARKAVSAAPQSASALLALSYAQQAHFNLDGAKESLEKAVELEPKNALAWARLAELYMSFGRLGDAQNAAWKAEDANPDLSRSQTVLGYAYLMRVKIREATDAFTRAIRLDQADPLPRLGLGLATIRDGELQEGRREIEIAVSLAAENAILRSYLGKAFYEEKEDKLAADQYGEAKRADSSDPTPYFYDAIRKQTVNRPVEALHDMQDAIERNDNRAVYRSRLLLDSDLAARSASMARIYSDLGFQQLALVEGWKSVNTDPTNFSSHRFLADSYSALPRHEIARVSELLQSQLLQPANTTPIQPRLAESNLFLLSAAGPGSMSFNEFNPIFNRDGLTFQASFLGGENETISGEAVVAGIYKNASFSIGYSHFETDGFRENADQEDEIGNAFLQLELSPQTSIQMEYRYRDNVHGDLRLRFSPDSFLPGERNREKRNSYRFGIRQSLSPSSTFLGSFSYQDGDFSLFDGQPVEPGLISISAQNDPIAIGGEGQYLYRSGMINVVGGFGHVDIEDEILSEVVVDFPPPPDGPGPLAFPATIGADVKHTNAYGYVYIQPVENLTFTAGLSGDFIKSETTEVGENNHANPKFGITWSPVPNTTLRAAAFRSTKRTLISNQTLEPTQVAGFNQFYDDVNGTEAWSYGGAVDQKVTRDIFAGGEFSKRDLTVPFMDFADPFNPVPGELEWEEYLTRAYFFYTPHPFVALKAEYMFERFNRDERLVSGLLTADTHRVPLGIRFFHPNGFSAFFSATYFDQKGDFEDFAQYAYVPGEDTFWILDTGISYRLPKRYGFLSIGATNLADRQFSYYDTDFNNPGIQPARGFYGRFTVALP